MKDLKYIAAFSIPIVAFLSIYLKGIWAYATPVYAFVFLPILELIVDTDIYNLNEDEKDNRLKRNVFDWLLYLNLPLVFGILIYALIAVTSTSLATQ